MQFSAMNHSEIPRVPHWIQTGTTSLLPWATPQHSKMGSEFLSNLAPSQINQPPNAGKEGKIKGAAG